MEALTPEALAAIQAALPTMTPADQEALLADLDRLAEMQRVQRCRDDFIEFCKAMYPAFLEGPHHRHLKPLLHEVLAGTQTRLTISLAPRFGKSHFIAYLFVA